KASCIGCSCAPLAMPSIVVTLAPSACQANMVQELRATPSTCTTQAPHWEVAQPTWVPVSRRLSRRYCTSRVRGSTVAVTALPFTVIETGSIAILLGLENGQFLGPFPPAPAF